MIARLATLAVRCAATLVPSAQRRQWREEWQAELAAVAARGTWAQARLVAGAPLDAWAARRAARTDRLVPDGSWRTALANDIRHAGRQLVRRPGHTLAVIACLVIGLVVSVATFSLLTTLLFGQLPGIVDRQDIARLSLSYERRTGDGRGATERIQDVPLALADLAVMRAPGGASPLDTVAVEGDLPMTVSTDRGPVRVTGAFASGDFFGMLGTRAVAGRLLRPDDDRPDAPPVAVVTEHFWQTHLGSRTDAIGAALLLSGQSFTLVGIAPPRFHGLHPRDLGQDDSAGIQVWVPLVHATTWPSRPGDATPWFTTAGRLRPGRTLEDVRAAFNVPAARLAAAEPATRSAAAATVRGYGLRARDGGMMALLVVLVMVLPLTVLAIGCANVANLQLAQATERTRELAVRLSIGASRGQILRLLTLETFARTVVALGLAWAGVALILRYVSGLMPLDVTMDWRVAIFAAGLSIAVAVLTGLLPAWLVLRSAHADQLKQDARSGGVAYRRLRSGLVVAQVAVSLALLVIGLVFVRTMQQMSVSAPAALSDQLVATFDPGELRRSPAESRRFADDLAARIAADGRVTGVALSQQTEVRYAPSGQPRPFDATLISINPSWMRVMALPLLSGRVPDAHEDAAVVVSRRAGERLAETGAILGRTLVLDVDGVQRRVEVVGMVEDRPTRPTRERPDAVLYTPLPATLTGPFRLHVRTTALDALPTDLRAAAAALDPDLTWVSVRRGDAAFLDDAREMASAALAVGISGVLALVLSATGLFAVISYLVTLRRREIGIRLAIGASVSGIVRLVVRQSLVLTGSGAAIGLGIAFPAATYMHMSFVEKVDHLDPVVYAGPLAVLVAVAVLAAAWPARRAAAVDPVTTLRRD